jgi:hypothetical protein
VAGRGVDGALVGLPPCGADARRVDRQPYGVGLQLVPELQHDVRRLVVGRAVVIGRVQPRRHNFIVRVVVARIRPVHPPELARALRAARALRGSSQSRGGSSHGNQGGPEGQCKQSLHVSPITVAPRRAGRCFRKHPCQCGTSALAWQGCRVSVRGRCSAVRRARWG